MKTKRKPKEENQKKTQNQNQNQLPLKQREADRGSAVLRIEGGSIHFKLASRSKKQKVPFIFEYIRQK